MPSLRRTLSSPSVRSSPYSTPSSSSTNQVTRQGGHGPRRSLGSETSGRRVLADIDWWTVHAGQIFAPGYVPPNQVHDEEDVQAEQDAPTDNLNLVNIPVADELVSPTSVWHTTLPGSGVGAFESELASVPYALGVNFDEPLSPLAQFAALSIAPRTPGYRRSTVSSESSVESTPASTIASLSPILDLGFSDIVAPPAVEYGLETVPFSFSSPSRPSRQGTMNTRSVSYSFFESTREYEQRFDDIPCFPTESFSCTIADVEDMFYQ